jgi:hypothetical protein
MPRKKHLSNLNAEEPQRLTELNRKGSAKARQFKRAMILLKASKGMTDAQIMAALNVCRTCMEWIRKRFVEGGLERAMNENPRPGQRIKLGGRGEAQLIAIAYSQAPEGHDHWTMRLRAGRPVELGVVESISHKTLRLTLKKHAEDMAVTHNEAYSVPSASCPPVGFVQRRLIRIILKVLNQICEYDLICIW